MADRDDDTSVSRAFQSGNRTPSDLRARRAVVTTAPEGVPIMLVEEPARPRSDTGERIAAAVADAALESRVKALEVAHARIGKAVMAVAVTALTAFGGVVTRIWTSAEAVTTERVLNQRVREDLHDALDRLRALERRSELQPDRADAVATTRSFP